MEELLMSLASKEGLFAVMFITLFLFQIVESRKREDRLMRFVDSISEQFEKLANQYEKLADDVDEIRVDMKDLSRK